MQENAEDFKRVKKAIKDRNISEVAWELLQLAIEDLERTGQSTRLGKTGLMELIRVISVQKGEASMQERMEKVSELKDWLRRSGPPESGGIVGTRSKTEAVL